MRCDADLQQRRYGAHHRATYTFDFQRLDRS